MSEHHWTKQNLICVVKYSSTEVSGPSEVPRFVQKLIFSFLRKSNWCVCVLHNQVFSRVQVIAM